MRPAFFFPRVTIIDCGTSRTSVAVFSELRSRRLRLEQYASVSFATENGQETNWLQKTTEAVGSLRGQIKIAGPVTVVLPPHLTLMKMLSTPRVEAAKREKIISFEGQQSIPYPLTDVVWDRMISGENAHAFHVLLCAAKLEILDPLCKALASAGFVPTVLLPSVLALAAGYREKHSRTALPALLINVGARSTSLILIDQSGFQARSLSLGASSGEVANSVENFANRLAQEITRTLLYFGRPLAPESLLHVILTGGATRSPELTGLLAKSLHVTVDNFDPTAEIEFGRETANFSREEVRAHFADLLGGAVLQLKSGQPPSNLLPPRLRQQAGRRRLRPRVAVAAGVAVTLLVPALIYERQTLASAQAKNAALERELIPLRAATARNQELQQRASLLRQRYEAGQKLSAARAGWRDFLGEIQSQFVEAGDVWLERMQLRPTTTGSATTGTPPGQPLRIAFTGLMQVKGGPDSDVRQSDYRRVRHLLEKVAQVRAVAAIEDEHFETVATGQLRFQFVVVCKEPLAL